MNQYYLAKLIQKVLLRCPLWSLSLLGRIIGLFFYYHPRKQRVAFRNIKSAFPEKSYQQVHMILKRSFCYLALDVIENLVAQRIYPYVTIKGEEHVTSCSGIFVGIHAGNWETAISLFAHKHPFAVFAKPQKNRQLDRFLTEVRQKGKIHVCFSLRELIRYLKKGYMIGLVIDHGAEKDAAAVKFFSHLVPTPKGAVYLARKFKKKIYPDFCYRQKGFCHVSEICEPIDPRGRKDQEVLTQLNKIYEDYLKKYPWEYFWYYKRFKRKINRDVVILSDGKLGHFKQSQALLTFLKQEKYLIRSRTIKVHYKNRLSRILADILACFVGKHTISSGRLLPFLVDKKTHQELDSVYADIVISTGSTVAPINRLFSSYLGAKSAVILRPNIPLKKFDLAIIPEHDRLQTTKATFIKGALSYPDNLTEKINNCRYSFKLSSSKKISFFVGGPLLNKKDFSDNLRYFVLKLKQFAIDKDYKLLISTSRRTPFVVQEYLEKELKNFKNIEALVIANRTNFDFTFEGFVALAEIVFVSNDSISMISEAAALNTSIVCVNLAACSNKHKVFLESIKNEITFLDKPYNIESITLKKSTMFANNKKILNQAVKVLF